MVYDLTGNVLVLDMTVPETLDLVSLTTHVMSENVRLCNQDLQNTLVLSENDDILKFYCTEYRRQTELNPSFILRDAVFHKQQPVVRGSTQAELFLENMDYSPSSQLGSRSTSSC